MRDFKDDFIDLLLGTLAANGLTHDIKEALFDYQRKNYESIKAEQQLIEDSWKFGSRNGILYWYIDDGTYKWVDYSNRDVNQMYYDASKCYAFSDLDDTARIAKIIHNGEEVYYCGFESNNHVTYKNKDGVITYENSFPQFDH